MWQHVWKRAKDQLSVAVLFKQALFHGFSGSPTDFFPHIWRQVTSWNRILGIVHISKSNINALQIGFAVSESVFTYIVLKEGGREANVELTTLNNLHIFNEVFHVFSAFQKWTRAKTSHITWICYNELLLLCSLNLSHYPTLKPHHKKQLTLTMRPVHSCLYNMFVTLTLINEYNVTMPVPLNNTCSIQWKQGTPSLNILSS